MERSTFTASFNNRVHFEKAIAGWVQAAWECDASGVIATESASWQKFTGQTLEELAHYGWIGAIHPEDRKAVLDHWREAFASATPIDVEFRVRKADGTWCWTKARAAARFEDGAIVRTWLGFNFDIGRQERSKADATHAEITYRNIVESAHDYALITTDATGSITSWSAGATAIYGWTPLQALGRHISMLLPKSIRDAGLFNSVRPILRGPLGHFNAWHVCRNGNFVYIEGSTRALRDHAIETSGLLLVGRDATERQRIERALTDNETRYRTLVENMGDHAVFLIDAFGIIMEWTTAAEFVTGYTATEAVGLHMSLLYTAEEISSDAVGTELVEAARHGRSEREAWRVHRSGRRIWSDEVTTALRGGDGKIFGYSKVLRDLTGRQNLAAARERERIFEQRERLQQSLALAEVDERRRIARELHDTAGQHVTALSLGVGALAALLDADSPERRQADELQALIALLGTELHDVSVRLRPQALDEFGFEEAIGAAARSWSRTSGIAVDLQIKTPAARLSPAIENALFRIVQEALTNVARHSGARLTSVVVERRDGYVHAIVEDDGIGFDVDGASRPGLGLRGIAERVDSLCGQLQIESESGRGTTVFVRLPIESL